MSTSPVAISIKRTTFSKKRFDFLTTIIYRFKNGIPFILNWHAAIGKLHMHSQFRIGFFLWDPYLYFLLKEKVSIFMKKGGPRNLIQRVY